MRGKQKKISKPAAEGAFASDIHFNRQGKLSDRVYEEIFREITLRGAAENQKLPSEMELCAHYGVSRPVLREAITRLKADGIVVSRQGSGNYIQRRPEPDFLQFAPEGAIADVLRCFEFRIGIEGEAAFFAAERRSKHHVALLRSIVDEMDACIERAELGNDADFRMHLAISDASGNDLFVDALWSMKRAMDFGMVIARNLSLRSPEGRSVLVQDEHRAILDAIAKQDPEAARLSMRSHISNARNRMLSRAEFL
ncbi:FadR/GntR family transcriptional regulator [Limibacillus sp. MBR-115]|jgi:DNA-binding FadR family transcriptional regulator|uniref:FadR/GntR family transcriptional regulator n=1 Tax=Limibacillus sp. MBR-115 TaxID=3156465 RepID=UPI003393DA3A